MEADDEAAAGEAGAGEAAGASAAGELAFGELAADGSTADVCLAVTLGSARAAVISEAGASLAADLFRGLCPALCPVAAPSVVANLSAALSAAGLAFPAFLRGETDADSGVTEFPVVVARGELGGRADGLPADGSFDLQPALTRFCSSGKTMGPDGG